MVAANPNIVTSRLGPTVLALFDLIEAAAEAGTIPAHPVIGKTPHVLFGHDPFNLPEYVTVIANPDETSNEWARLGPASRDETFTVSIGIRSMVRNSTDPRAVWERTTELAAAVELLLYDTTTGRPIRLDVPNLAPVQRVRALDQALIPQDGGMWHGAALLYCDFLAVI